MYTADDSDELWEDEGMLYAFVADRTPPRIDDYFDLQPATTIGFGDFVRGSRDIAKTRLGLPTGGGPTTDVMSSDFSAANGYGPSYTAPP